MSNIAYYRVSTAGQDVESQRHTLLQTYGGTFDQEFVDEGVSGAVLAAQRPGFAALLKYVRKGDVVLVEARPIFECGGGIHCITQQQPAV